MYLGHFVLDPLPLGGGVGAEVGLAAAAAHRLRQAVPAVFGVYVDRDIAAGELGTW